MGNKKNIATLLKEGEEIVISGMSGRFPESDSIDEFTDNLYKNVDMISGDGRRWPIELYGMNPRMGKLKNIDKFDGSFFGIMADIGDNLDPQIRMLLETTYEAIMDAGINPQSLRGSSTGVYIGYTSVGMTDGTPPELQPDLRSSIRETLLWIGGSGKSMYANRISFICDFKGPSMVVDTACSSSMTAFDLAVTDMRLGKCDQAIIGGVAINLQPFTNHMYQTVFFNSSEGQSKVWDEEANGFVRGETVACLFLQKKPEAKRIYATILHSRTNIDGYKKLGMFFPSTEFQRDLMIQTYKEANVNPLDVNFFEAHGTGTIAGDPQEAKAIYNSFCIGRKDKLPIGLLKSNVGHAEGASGVASVAKVLITFENECIPANLNLKKIKPEIAEMCPPLNPVIVNTPYVPGIAGVNSFGVGGVNGTALLEPNYKKLDENSLKIIDKIPRLVNLCGRTEDALKHLFDFIEKNSNKITQDFLALLSDTMKINPALNSSGFPYRGSMLIKQVIDENNNIEYQYQKQSSLMMGKTLKPVWLFFSGLGGQWPGMAKALMPIDIFANKLKECSEIMKPFGVDLEYLLLSDDEKSMSTMTNKFIATTAMQIALYEVFKKLDITFDGIIGHSFGEIACAYADECLTTEEAMLTSYWRGIITENDKEIPKGLMAAVGLSWEETKKMCPNGVYVVCNNGKNSVTISGPYDMTKQFIETLNEKKIFVRELDSNNLPYHSPYLTSSGEKMTEVLKNVIKNPKQRSNKWTSTSYFGSKSVEERGKYASAEYFVYNLLHPVMFYNALQTLPSDAIVVEIAPHSLFANIITKSLESVSYIPLAKRNQNDTNLEFFLTAIGKLYQLGVNPSIDKLYPKVEWPVARSTQSISSLIKWDHNESYVVKKYPEHHFRSTASDLTFTISQLNSEDRYLFDHSIDGKAIFPATGYLLLAWRRFAASRGRIWSKLPVIFENVAFRRATFLSKTDTTKLTVRLLEPTGEFVILEGSNVSCFGTIRSTDEDILQSQNLIYDNKSEFDVESDTTLDSSDIYKDLRIRGYDYGPEFQGVQEVRNEDTYKSFGKVKWTGNIISFMDSVLQVPLISVPFKKILVPVMISSLRCDPKVLFDAIEECKQVLEESVKKEEKFTNLEQVFEEREEQIKDMNLNTEFDVKDEELQTAEVKDIVGNLEIIEERTESASKKYFSVLPLFADMNLKTIVTHGLEIKGMIAAPIPRMLDTQELKLESYQFIPNDENEAIELMFKKEVTEYIEACNKLANDIMESSGMSKPKNENNLITDEMIKKYLLSDKEEHVMIKLLDSLLSLYKKDKENTTEEKEKLKKLVNEKMKEPEFDLTKDLINLVSKNERLIRPLLDIVSENNVPKKELKVLEINLSNAIMAKEVDNYLASAAIYPIDIDYTLVNNSLDDLNEDLKRKSFKLIEWNTKESPFPADIPTADLLLYRDSHDLWDLKLDNYLKEVQNAIKDKGFLLTVFRYKYISPELVLNELFEENSVSDTELTKRINEFETETKKIGLNLICRKSDSIGSIALLFRKVLPAKEVKLKEQNVVEISSDYEKWFEILKEKLLEIKESENKEDRLWLIANDSCINGIIGLVLCLRQEPGGDKIRCIFDYDMKIKLPINFSEKPFCDILENDLVVNIIRDSVLGTYRHITLTKCDEQNETSDYYLNVGPRGELSSLQWFDSKNITSPDRYIFKDKRSSKMIRCNVYSTGLNFRDVMVASGRVMAGPLGLFTDCVIGTEFAGRRADTGERIFGYCCGRGISTFVDTREDMTSLIPEKWSMEECVTIVSTYCTVWYSLIERARLQRNESILIHSAAGGVGQAAVCICQHYNCDIYVTVGNEEKKQFLINEYNIPENKIFSSRDIQFEDKIMSLTKGKGVNLVLNSLAEEKLEAGFRCVGDNGRFVEIGKYDLQMNRKLGMFAFLRNISFHGITPEQIFIENPEIIKNFFKFVHENCNNGCIKPINRTVFKPTEAEQAFRYMTTGKHIGKIVINMRDEEPDKGPVLELKPTPRLSATSKTFFDPKKVYIIIGGLGGFGLELMHWMSFNGARKLILTSRSGVRTSYQRTCLSKVEAIGKLEENLRTEITVSTHDTNTIEGTKRLLEDANELGPIGGIFHLALVLNDSFYENQTIESFRETCVSKIDTFVNLDKLTRDLYPNIDYLVCFSSVTSGKGNAGQTNYGFANSVLERICEQRRKDGFHGLAIQWGPIGDVGVIADQDLSSFSGIVKQRIYSCLDVLDKLLQSKHAIVSSIVRANRETQSGSLEDRLINQLWTSLGVDPKTLPPHVTLGELGMESLFAVQFQQDLEREYSVKMTLNDIKNITVKQLKDFQNGNKDVLRQTVDEVKIARANLIKIKFIIPAETHTKLNSVQTGNPIYFLPPVEGIFSTMDGLAKKINRPVIGLNWTQDMNSLKTIKEISGYYINLLKKLSPNGNYDIVGHSFGALIAVKMLSKAPVGRAVIIDIISNTPLDEEAENENQFFEIIYEHFMKNMPKVLQERIDRELKPIKDDNEKLKKMITSLKEFGGKSLVDKDMEEIFRNTAERGKLIYNYRKKSYKKLKQFKATMKKKYLKLNGKLFIIKPFEDMDESNIEDMIKESYNIPINPMDENINIEPLITKPDEILTGNVEKVAELINKYLPVEGSRLEVQESKKVSNIDRVHSPVPIESRNA